MLLSAALFRGEWQVCLKYLVPLCAFVLGTAAAEKIHMRYKNFEKIHWRQMILVLEIVFLLVVGFLPNSVDPLANALVSFVCALQVQTFHKVEGHVYASTMCIGNLRSGVESLCAWGRTKSPESRRKAGRYFGVILLFALGAGLGSLSLGWWGARAIWLSCVLLAVSFLLMFIREDLEEDPVIQKELSEIHRDSAAIRQELGRELREDLSGKKL